MSLFDKLNSSMSDKLTDCNQEISQHSQYRIAVRWRWQLCFVCVSKGIWQWRSQTTTATNKKDGHNHDVHNPSPRWPQPWRPQTVATNLVKFIQRCWMSLTEHLALVFHVFIAVAGWPSWYRHGQQTLRLILMMPVNTETLENSTALNISIFSENNFWMLLSRLVSTVLHTPT